LIGLTFESGAAGFLQTNCLERVQERVFLTGHGSWVAVDDWRRVTAFLRSRETPFSWDPYEQAHPYVWEPYDQLPTDTQDLRTVHGYTAEVRYFVECVRDERTPTPNISDGIAHLKIEFAAKRSAREKRPVAIAEIG
jgi:predicted dehydrogenase